MTNCLHVITGQRNFKILDSMQQMFMNLDRGFRLIRPQPEEKSDYLSMGSSMSKGSNWFSSHISYIHYPLGQTGSGNIRSPTSVRRELTARSRRENLTSTSSKYACEAFCTQAVATFSFCKRLNLKTLWLRSKGKKRDSLVQ